MSWALQGELFGWEREEGQESWQGRRRASGVSLTDSRCRRDGQRGVLPGRARLRVHRILLALLLEKLMHMCVRGYVQECSQQHVYNSKNRNWK